VVDVGEDAATRDHLLEVSRGQRPIAALEMFFSESNQLPDGVVHTVERSTHVK